MRSIVKQRPWALAALIVIIFANSAMPQPVPIGVQIAEHKLVTRWISAHGHEDESVRARAPALFMELISNYRPR